MQHNFADGTVGIRVDEGDRVKFLPYSMAKLLQANDVIFAPERLGKCGMCGKQKNELGTKELSTCNGCKVSLYCGKVCFVLFVVRSQCHSDVCCRSVGTRIRGRIKNRAKSFGRCSGSR